MFRDSLDKVIGGYMGQVCREPFTYKGVEYQPRPVIVSPLIFRGFTCPPLCGGCCPSFSLDYLPGEARPRAARPRRIMVSGQNYFVLSDMQDDNADHHCRNLDKGSGRCKIYEVRPFSCDFELIRFFRHADRTVLTQQLFGRGWNLLRIDGQRGALCEMTTPDTFTTLELVRKLKRLKAWTEYFGVAHCVDQVVAWAETGPHLEPLFIAAPEEMTTVRPR